MQILAISYLIFYASECKCVNGACNNGPEGDGACECFYGYMGKVCDKGKMTNKSHENYSLLALDRLTFMHFKTRFFISG